MFKRITQTLLAMALVVGVVDLTTANESQPFTEMIGHYEPIRQTLVNDSIEGVADHAKQIAKRSRMLLENFSAESAGVTSDRATDCQALLPEITRAAEKLAAAQSIEETREAFSELSRPLVRYREMVGGERPIVVYCPMVKKSWLQREGELENPYSGQGMLSCGEVVSK